MVLGLLFYGVLQTKQLTRQFQPPPDSDISFAEIPSFGFDRLKADLLWISFILYIGDIEQRSKLGLAEAPSRLTSIIDADPTLMPPYWFAAFTLGGDLKNPGAAATILDRGIRANPQNWYLYYIAGFNQYLSHTMRSEPAIITQRQPHCPVLPSGCRVRRRFCARRSRPLSSASMYWRAFCKPIRVGR